MTGVGTNAVAALPVVLAAVEDPDLGVQGTAMFAYAAVEPDKARLVHTLVGWLRTKPVKVLSVFSATQALAVWRRPHGSEVQPLVSELIRMTDSPDVAIQAKAFSTLSSFGEQCAPAKDRALAALKSTSSDVRRSACFVLSSARLEPELIIPLLVQLAEADDDPSVRTAAVDAMSYFGADSLPLTGAFRPQVEKAIRERAERERLWQRFNPK